MGEVAFIDPKSGRWCKTNIDTTLSMEYLWIDQICYFNSDTAIVSGNIKNKDKRRFICRTTNGGKNWTPVETAAELYIADAAYLDNGEAWLCAPGSAIAYTKDFGVTWSSLPLPTQKESFQKICFNYKLEGIIGSLWNVLAYTPDNCKTWITLPTPLNQGKYRRLSLDRPEFNRVAIFNDYLLVSQEKLVFYSKKDTINWIPLPGFTDFYTDAANSALFFKRLNGTFTKYDSHLQPICSFENIGKYEAAICRNGSLFTMREDKITQINRDNKLIVSPMYTNINEAGVEPSPRMFDIKGGRTYNSVGNKIYIYDRYGNIKTCTLPFITDSGYLSMKDTGTVLFSRNDDSLFFYTIANKKVQRTTNKKMLERFCAKGIKTIVFSSGADRAHHHVYSSDTMVYELRNDRFVLARKVHEGQMFVNLRNEPGEIDNKVVDEFVKTIPAIYKKQATIDDLGFTSEEYDSCRKNILAFQKYIEGNPVLPSYHEYEGEEEGTFRFFVNNLDFDKLIALVDSVKAIKPDVISKYFYSSQYYKNNNSLQFVLVNNNNEELEIKASNSSYYTPYCFPWYISLNGSHMPNRTIEINRFLKAIYPEFLVRAGKVRILQFLVKQLYIDKNY